MNFTKYVKARNEKFGTVIFETLKEKVYVTNKTGTDILKLLQEGKSPDEISEILGNEYEKNGADSIRTDVSDFINQLKQEGLMISAQ